MWKTSDVQPISSSILLPLAIALSSVLIGSAISDPYRDGGRDALHAILQLLPYL